MRSLKFLVHFYLHKLFNLVFEILSMMKYDFLCRRKPMTAVAFSADGSVLAVAAETVITLWDPEKNVLVVVVGEMQEVISEIQLSLALSFFQTCTSLNNIL